MITWPPNFVPAPRPALGRAGRPRARGIPAFALPAAVAIAALAAAGCGLPAPSDPPASPSPTAAPATASPPAASPADPAAPSLLLLAEAGGRRSLSLIGPAAGPLTLPVPDPSTMAVLPMGDGTLVAVVRDGRAFVARQGVAGLRAGTGWQPLELRWVGTLPARAIIFGASVSPDGSRLAAIARPPDAEGPSALVVIEPSAGRSFASTLADESLGPPPAWLDDSSVAVVQRDVHGRTFLGLVTVATGTLYDRIPLRAPDFRTSGDGRTAVLLGDEDRLLAGASADIVGLRRAPDGGPATQPGDRVSGGLALDHDGRRLAVVVMDQAGDGLVATFERTGAGWEARSRIAAPPGSGGGVVAWLP